MLSGKTAFFRSVRCVAALIASTLIMVGIVVTPSTAANPAIRDALIIRDSKVLREANFTFERTLAHLFASNQNDEGLRTADEILSAGPAGNEFLVGKLKQWLISNPEDVQLASPNSALNTEFYNLFPKNFPFDLLLEENSPFYLYPIAVLNRIDLASIGFPDCGEFRIVYGFKKGAHVKILHELENRKIKERISELLLIFESRPPVLLDDEDTKSKQVIRAEKQQFCHSVAKTWKEIEASGSGTALQRDMLQSFFYGCKNSSPCVVGSAGWAAKNKGVMDADNFRWLSKVRANIEFRTAEPVPKWALLEWQSKNDTKHNLFKPRLQALGDSISLRLFEPKNSPFNSSALEQLQKQFFTTDLPDFGQSLANPCTVAFGHVATALANCETCDFDEYVNLLGIVGRTGVHKNLLKYGIVFGIMSGNVDDHSFNAEKICSNGEIPGVDCTNPTSVIHSLQRLEPVSCVGCHLSSSGKPLYGRKNGWPVSQRFTHITPPVAHTAGLSLAMQNEFLKFRNFIFRMLVSDSGDSFPTETFTAAYQNYWTEGLKDEFVDYQLTLLEKELHELVKAGSDNGELVYKIREITRALPGAFVPGRRTH